MADVQQRALVPGAQRLQRLRRAVPAQPPQQRLCPARLPKAGILGASVNLCCISD